jgi:hypothetical protein
MRPSALENGYLDESTLYEESFRSKEAPIQNMYGAGIGINKND